MNQRIRNHLALVVTAIVVLVVTPACTNSTAASAACGVTAVGSDEPAIVVLNDGNSPALTATVRSLAEDPGAAFGSARLTGRSTPQDSAPLGVVVLATYDNRGAVTTHGSYDLAGVGNDDRLREQSRRQQATCLTKAVAALPQAPEGSGDLLRTLERAASLAVEQSTTGHAAVVAIGLGRSTIDGRPIAGLDLTAAGQAQIFAELDRVGLIPDLSTVRVALRFVDPSDGVASSISAAGVESFATSLCEHLRARPCTTGPGLH